MGIINFGLPIKKVNYLKNLFNLSIFVEGGTYIGLTAYEQSKNFKKVYTIEKSKKMIELSRKRLDGIDNIIQLNGDTRDHLKKILSNNDNILFWLDSHWSGGETYGKNDECPLLEELKIIFNSRLKNFVILIDDARLFLSPPPLPHKIINWPNIRQIFNFIPSSYDVVISEDVIIIFPVSTNFLKFMQNKNTEDWQKLSSLSFFSRTLKILVFIKNKVKNLLNLN